MMTMGFVMPEADQQRAQALVGTMASVQYFSPAEVSALPIVKKPHQNIVYGPLAQFPLEADVVLCIITTEQAMLISEAMGNMNWLQSGGQSAFGRPTCAIIPRTMQTNQISMSFGCVGARTYTGLTTSCRVSRTFADNSCSKCGTGPIPSRAKRSLSIDIAINDQYNQFIKRPLGHM